MFPAKKLVRPPDKKLVRPFAPGKRERDSSSSAPAASSTPPGAEAAQDSKHVRRETFKLDPDTLECPICSETFSPPVFQCENGHTACASCCEKLNKGCGGCPTCTRPIGHIRNLAVEKIVESLQVPCKYSGVGCREMMLYTKRDEHHHTRLCEYQPICCPVAACALEIPKCEMPMHLTRKHQMKTVALASSTRSATFRMKASGTFEIVTAPEAWLLVYFGHDESLGDYFYCNSCWAAKKVVYSLKVTRVDVQNESNMVFIMQGVAHDKSRIHAWKFDYLVVPEVVTCTNADEDTKKEFEITLSILDNI